MKTPLKVLSAGFFAALVAVSASATVFAAGINDAEQSILDELHTTVTMAGVEKSLPVDYINQAENYFNTVEVTNDEATQIIAGIEDAKSYLESTGASNFKSLSSSQVDTFVAKCQSVVSVIDLSLSYDKTSGAVAIVDTNGTTVFSTTVSPIKVTGANFNIPGIAVIAGVGILLVSAAGVYLIKNSKKKSLADVRA